MSMPNIGIDGRFEVMLRTGEDTWEMAFGPYDMFEKTERARLDWFQKKRYTADACSFIYA